MPIRLGASTPSRIYLGSNEIAAAYIGATQVWPEGPVYDPDTMVLTMATTGASAEERTVRIPFASTALNIDIDWGDGNVDVGVNAANPEHVYAAEDTYTIQVTGAARTLGSGAVAASTRWSTKLRSVIQWGDLGLTSLFGAFREYSGTSLPLPPGGFPSGITSLQNTFRACSNLTSPPDVSGWNTANVTTMADMFISCSSLTSPPDVSGWNTANVTSLVATFSGCSDITSPPDVSGWNTANVTSLASTFSACSSLTSPPDVSGWNTANVTSLVATFSGCSDITSPPDVSGWNTANVTTLQDTFYNCSSLTSPPNVASWNTAKVQRMTRIFRNLGALDIPCDDWSIAGVTTPNSFDNMFLLVTLPTARYDALLVKWEAQAVKPTGANFHGGSSKYTAAPSAAATARASLANPATNNWTMADGGT